DFSLVGMAFANPNTSIPAKSNASANIIWHGFCESISIVGQRQPQYFASQLHPSSPCFTLRTQKGPIHFSVNRPLIVLLIIWLVFHQFF
ncbi:MAG: hypothetical protein RSC31_06185, partial [Anaerovoracaceae bacterium]